ncbi:hypothetical protein EGJ86_19280 [Pseudomonas sp. o96-267]|uniref:phosphoadenosine phosphosulfate reductase domain-containing protein n=1 Tax=Pseudomonas sp. o96-267 TaxID=2479853 RepID=UPI000F7AAA09|nr:MULTISPECIES: phosphoadenosine phosphosulfate reductase family protein [Pseudomonas]MDH0959089.1 phosphoadenosine phosphosulfate reductase family protein [Pseudomonas chengduensis]MDV5863603.1 phosphoadenosine phosphosulfate reductase family protein [Pseudomonas mendocina]RRV31716.1 hypothetical protein EGJ86_19280 [Pseudomonas sp. o96-267]
MSAIQMLMPSMAAEVSPAKSSASSNASLDEKIAGAIEAIQRHVKMGMTPIIAFSAGKDSSVTLSLAITAFRQLKAEGFNVPTLHVMHSDTLVENPALVGYNKRQLKKIEQYSERSGLSIRVWVAKPGLSGDYLVSMIGGRTIASVGNNAKCQQSLKAVPMARLRRLIRKEVAEQAGVKPADAPLFSLIGTRFDESAARKRAMEARGESALDAVEVMSGSGELVLSPIAQFTEFDVFEYIGRVRSEQIECYDDFSELVAVYRSMNGGECMVNAYLAGKSQSSSPCSASGRSGCWACCRVSRDTSAENMIASDSGEYRWMEPLNRFRNFLMARHFDPAARCWLGRTVNEETGTVQLSPNSYSPAFTLQLLALALSIQANEQLAASKAGVPPRFTLLSLRQVIAIDMLWGRYGYQKPFTALRIYKAVYEQGKRWRIPDVASMPTFTEKDIAFRGEVPFCDEEYNDVFNGLRNLSAAAADCESLTVTRSGALMTAVNEGAEFDVDEEGAELFWEFESDRALKRIGVTQAPSEVVHYFLGLGTVELFKGTHGEWNRMLKLSNQIHRSGLTPILHDPQAIMARLGGGQVASGAQMPMF